MVEGLGGRQELSEVEIQRPQFRFFDFISENTGKMEAFQARQAHMTTHHLGTWRFANVNSDLFRASTVQREQALLNSLVGGSRVKT